MLPKSYKQHFIDINHLSQATENEESCFLHDIIAITNLFKYNVYILNIVRPGTRPRSNPVILGGPGPGETYLMAGSSTGSKKRMKSLKTMF